MKKLENKTVFITGGLSGIGKACAVLAAKEGANVAIADIQSNTTELAMQEIKAVNSKAIFIPCDVSDFAQVGNAIKKTIDTFSSLDVALNNAGVGGEANDVGDMTQEAWLKVIGINLNGVFYCMKHELQQMAKQQSGVIINMASILGKVGFAKSSHYVAAKHGVVGLTQTAAMEYATRGIRINAICPGFIETPLLTKGGIEEDNDAGKWIKSLHPMKRLGRAEEIAEAFLFLASESGSFVTGTAMEVDGGYLAQ